MSIFRDAVNRLADQHEEKNMSDTKPSRAARELAEDLARIHFRLIGQPIPEHLLPWIGVTALKIDDALADLLEKATASLRHLENGGYYETHRDLKSALEPWKQEQ